MVISEVVKKLKALQEKHGDLPVYYPDNYGANSPLSCNIESEVTAIIMLRADGTELPSYCKKYPERIYIE